MADGRSSLASDFKAGLGGKAGEENQSDTDAAKTLIREGKSLSESAGLVDGISDHESFQVSQVEPNYDYERDPLTGNSTERKKLVVEKSVSSKGYTFQLDDEI